MRGRAAPARVAPTALPTALPPNCPLGQRDDRSLLSQVVRDEGGDRHQPEQSEESRAKTPTTGPALPQASEAALLETGGGRVTETEVGDEESRYEVEVTLDDGSQVDVQLDDQFRVVGSKTDRENG